MTEEELRENVKQIRSGNQSLGSLLESAAIDELMQLIKADREVAVRWAWIEEQEWFASELREMKPNERVVSRMLPLVLQRITELRSHQTNTKEKE